MFQRTRISLVGVGLLLVLGAVSAHAGDLPASEAAKIEALLQHIAQQTDAVFIRNDKTYPATIAARYLRDKWAATFVPVTTAHEFIAHIASVSSTSGQPYRIRFPDGREMPTGEYLRLVLHRLEH